LHTHTHHSQTWLQTHTVGTHTSLTDSQTWLPVPFAWHLVLCKGSDVRPGVPWSPPLCRWLLRGRCGTWCSARGRMYTLASLGLRRSAGGFCVAGAALGALQAVGWTPWRPFVSAALPVAFPWQVRRFVLCKRSDVRPGVPWSPPLCRWLLRGRRSTWCSAMLGCTPRYPPVSPCVRPVSLGLRRSSVIALDYKPHHRSKG